MAEDTKLCRCDRCTAARNAAICICHEHKPACDCQYEKSTVVEIDWLRCGFYMSLLLMLAEGVHYLMCGY
jgi:hypothetical protein